MGGGLYVYIYILVYTFKYVYFDKYIYTILGTIPGVWEEEGVLVWGGMVIGPTPTWYVTFFIIHFFVYRNIYR
jgi:hypothetical protein